VSIRSKLAELSARGEKAVGLFLTCGFPSQDETSAILDTLAETGVDFLELGMPFSDPLAEGITIQRSSEIALRNGVTLRDVLDTVTRFKSRHDLPLLLIVVYTVVTTLVWGRVFCGFLCPFGALQDVIDRVVPRRFKRPLPQGLHDRASYVKYGVLAVIVIPALAGSHVSLYQYFEPFGTVFFRSPSLLLWAIAGAFLAASVVIPRFYCRYACPLGAALGIVSLISLKRIDRVEQCGHCKVCEQKCPTGAIRGATVDFKECVRCNVCEIELIERTGVCRHDMEYVRARLVQLEVGAGVGVTDG